MAFKEPFDFKFTFIFRVMKTDIEKENLETNFLQLLLINQMSLSYLI